ncbi:MAG: hypothetical protein IAG13_13305, partial [Deltaproteobacteria bacterium]|nr:hypothetical protein [Nannocystaceae bacterium]
MTPSSLRLRLALALGLPLGPACKSPPPVAPRTPTETPTTVTPTKPAAPAMITTSTGSTCAPDHVHERVCGLISSYNTEGGGPAAPPYEHCTMNGHPLWDTDWEHMIDGWRLGDEKSELVTFTFDAPGTAAFKYTGTYQPDDPRCCYERCKPIHALAKPRKYLDTRAHEYELCLPAPETTAFPAATASHCPIALRTRHFYPYGVEDPLDDAPFTRADDDQCCYSVATLHRCPPNTFETEDGGCESPSPGGRPLREAGSVVVAPTRAR